MLRAGARRRAHPAYPAAQLQRGRIEEVDAEMARWGALRADLVQMVDSPATKRQPFSSLDAHPRHDGRGVHPGRQGAERHAPVAAQS
jgi:hypothetical protein